MNGELMKKAGRCIGGWRHRWGKEVRTFAVGYYSFTEQTCLDRDCGLIRRTKYGKRGNHVEGYINPKAAAQ